MKSKKAFLLPPLIACLLTSTFFAYFIMKGKVPIPADTLPGVFYPWRDLNLGGYQPGKFPVKNPLITDPVIATYPWRFTVITNIKQKSWPLWNPYNFSGQPLLGNFESAPFQVLNLIFFILPFKLAWAVQIILPEILTTLFMYLFLKSIKVSTVSSVFASFVLPFSGFFVAWMSMGIIVTAAMWLPLILLCINKLLQKTTTLYFLLLTFALSQTIFSGHIQTAYSVFAASSLYTAFLFKYNKARTNIIVCLLAAILAILITAPQTMPTLEFISLSARSIDQAYNLGRSWFLAPQNLIQIVAPDFFGNPSTYNYWGASNYAEFVAFIGLVPLSFTLLGLSKHPKSKDVYFFSILALLSLLLALPNFISKIPYLYHWPYISSAQPSRVILLFIFSLVVLSAYGMDRFLQLKNKKFIIAPVALLSVLMALFLATRVLRSEFPTGSENIAYRNLIFPILTAGTLVGIYAAAVLFKVNQKIIITVIFFLTAFELFRFSAKFTSFSKLSWVFPETETTHFLSNQQKPFRVMATNGLILHPNTSSVYGVEMINGYDPLYLKSYAKLISAIESNDPNATITSFNRTVLPSNYNSSVINLLNVKYVLSFDEIKSEGFIKVFEEGNTKIYENKKVLPRFFFVSEIQKKGSKGQELESILDPNTNFENTAVSSETSFKKTENTGKIIVNRYSDQSVHLTTISSTQAPLVASNISYPGWIAKIDGKPAKTSTVNYNLQSIIVPAGMHNIELKYFPKSFRYGLYLAALGAVSLAISALYISKLSKGKRN